LMVSMIGTRTVRDHDRYEVECIQEGVVVVHAAENSMRFAAASGAP
jgi:hypothetical protein